MKYKKEVETILTKSLRKDWMNNKDFEELIELLEEQTNLSRELLTSQIKEGVNNGYSVELQMKVVEKIINQYV